MRLVTLLGRSGRSGRWSVTKSQTNLQEWGAEVDLSLLDNDDETRAFVAVRMNGVSVRDHADARDVDQETVEHLLAKAERKMGLR